MRLAWALVAVSLHAETGRDAWLRYRQTTSPQVTMFGDSPLLASARNEMTRGARGRIALGTLARLPGKWGLHASLRDDGYWLKTLPDGVTVVTASNDRGVLYGAFALLRKIALGESTANLDEKQSPAVPIRWVNEWDNLDGSIERGYGGRSIFWSREDVTRVGEYGRLLASLGINGCSINNVNADKRVLETSFLPRVARIAGALRPWGVKTVLSVDFGSPQTIGGLNTFDPLDPRVAAWWMAKVDELYRAVPDLGGFVLKADSEGRVGPSAYGRTHADAANVVARALKPHGGFIFYRGFVYDHHMDWRNPKNDRARAAYDNFKELDGMFDDNVVIQIKHGPIDFQVREPVSPLFNALTKTNQAIELQITQEYMGQARHLVFLPPMWKESVDQVKGLVKGFVGVANVGLDDNWLGNHLSQANLYGFGRLAWNPSLDSKQIADEWTRLTFGDIKEIPAMLLRSWRTYENYTGPLGLQTLTDIVGNHYGVAVEASERNGWGQWHRADEQGVGMDRTVTTGTGFIGQYPPAVARIYESIETCPDDLLLFMHHVPYTHRLHSGKTVVQSIYDSHYEGAETVAGYVREWKALKGRIDDQRYREILAQLEYQAGQAIVWRDAVAGWFLRASNIPDARGRVGHYPGRVEAESMRLEGYAVTDVIPWETASGGKGVACSAAQCAAAFRYNGPDGVHTVQIQYFDQNNGVSRFRLSVAKRLVDEWVADDHLPTTKLDGTSSTRRSVGNISLRRGDEIRIEGIRGGDEVAAIDYIEIQ